VHEVTALRTRHELVTEVVMALDVDVPPQRVVPLLHRLDAERCLVEHRRQQRLEHCLLDVRMGLEADWFGALRRRQCDQVVRLHPQQRYAATHVLELPVGAAASKSDQKYV
jgi:hypothetical protein